METMPSPCRRYLEVSKPLRVEIDMVVELPLVAVVFCWPSLLVLCEPLSRFSRLRDPEDAATRYVSAF